MLAAAVFNNEIRWKGLAHPELNKLIFTEHSFLPWVSLEYPHYVFLWDSLYHFDDKYNALEKPIIIICIYGSAVLCKVQFSIH